MSRDIVSAHLHFHAMAKAPLSEHDIAFMARTQEARKAKFKAAKDMAKAMGVDKERYAKWENRTPIPHEFVEQFCLVAGVSIEWLFTGKERRRV